jgi:hypothetical protein
MKFHALDIVANAPHHFRKIGLYNFPYPLSVVQRNFRGFNQGVPKLPKFLVCV